MHTVGVISVLMAAGLAGYSAWESWWARASRTWPSVFGTITESKVERGWNRPPVGANDAPRPPDENAKIEHHYEVNGKIY